SAPRSASLPVRSSELTENMTKNLIGSVVGVALSLGIGAVNATAGSYNNNFNSDPTTDPNFRKDGNAVWRATGSYNGSGYISLTDAVGGQQGTIVLPDFDGGFAAT